MRSVQSTGHEPGGGAAATTRVFLLDDHEVVRRGVRELLEGEGDDIEVVGEAGTAEEALGAHPRGRAPTSRCSTCACPTATASRSAARSGPRHPEIQCLMLTSFADDEALFDAIMAGAAGYVLKQVRGNDLVDACSGWRRGQSLLDPSMTAAVLERLRRGPDDDDGRRPTSPSRSGSILDLLAEGLTNRQIGERLYLAEKTVKNYVSNLLDEAGHAPAHRGRGLRRPPGRQARPSPQLTPPNGGHVARRPIAALTTHRARVVPERGIRTTFDHIQRSGHPVP